MRRGWIFADRDGRRRKVGYRAWETEVGGDCDGRRRDGGQGGSADKVNKKPLQEVFKERFLILQALSRVRLQTLSECGLALALWGAWRFGAEAGLNGATRC